MNARYPLDWMGLGYDVFPAAPIKHPSPSTNDAWALVDAAVASARRGIFDLLHQLPAIIARTHDSVLHSVACEVVGDGGNATDLEVLVQLLESADFEAGLNIVRALVARGRLVDVPAVFSFYELHYERKDAVIVQGWLNWWLCAGDEAFPVPGGDTSWEEYRARVGQRYLTLWNTLGTNLVHVHAGQALDLGRVLEGMRAHLKLGVLHLSDRHLFEAMTGISCRRWYEGGRENVLRVVVELDRFVASGRVATYIPGQRSFMGYPLQDVAAACELLDAYPDNGGLGVPFIRTAFDVDDDLALDYGFKWQGAGYFYKSPAPPPTARVPVSSRTPWLSLHTCLREAKEGNREPLVHLASLVYSGQDDMFLIAAVELLADAADDTLLDPWRETIDRAEDLDLAFDLSYGLLRRGMLRDVPRVLTLFRRHPTHLDYSYFRAQLDALFVRVPVDFVVDETLSVPAYCDEIERRYQALRGALGGDVPIFRGALASVRGVAQEIIHLAHGPVLTYDLRARFEASTGIDCSDWSLRDKPGFDHERAATVARQFLDGDAAAFEPGVLFFFGRPIVTTTSMQPSLSGH